MLPRVGRDGDQLPPGWDAAIPDAIWPEALISAVRHDVGALVAPRVIETLRAWQAEARAALDSPEKQQAIARLEQVGDAIRHPRLAEPGKPSAIPRLDSEEQRDVLVRAARELAGALSLSGESSVPGTVDTDSAVDAFARTPSPIFNGSEDSDIGVAARSKGSEDHTVWAFENPTAAEDESVSSARSPFDTEDGSAFSDGDVEKIAPLRRSVLPPIRPSAAPAKPPLPPPSASKSTAPPPLPKRDRPVLRASDRDRDDETIDIGAAKIARLKRRTEEMASLGGAKPHQESVIEGPTRAGEFIATQLGDAPEPSIEAGAPERQATTPGRPVGKATTGSIVPERSSFADDDERPTTTIPVPESLSEVRKKITADLQIDDSIQALPPPPAAPPTPPPPSSVSAPPVPSGSSAPASGAGTGSGGGRRLPPKPGVIRRSTVPPPPAKEEKPRASMLQVRALYLAILPLCRELVPLSYERRSRRFWAHWREVSGDRGVRRDTVDELLRSTRDVKTLTSELIAEVQGVDADSVRSLIDRIESESQPPPEPPVRPSVNEERQRGPLVGASVRVEGFERDES